MQVIQCGLMDFDTAYALQEQLAADIALSNEPETLLLLEHSDIYTMGSGGNNINLLDPDIRVIRTNRGGDVTWHGPGQLVVYPLINLLRRGGDLHRWLRFLEELLIRCASHYRVEASRIQGLTGVWTERGKLASIGVGVRRQITMHGFALNVHPDLTQFSKINPCGLPGCPMTSLALEATPAPTLAAVAAQVTRLFQKYLNELLPIVATGPSEDEIPSQAGTP